MRRVRGQAPDFSSESSLERRAEFRRCAEGQEQHQAS